jgi:hypothetical protein
VILIIIDSEEKIMIFRVFNEENQFEMYSYSWLYISHINKIYRWNFLKTLILDGHLQITFFQENAFQKMQFGNY